MHTIEIDFDVFKALTVRRKSEETTYNDVLRDLLRLQPVRRSVQESVGAPSSGDWLSKGVRFPAGTEFRANYKGVTHGGRVENGALSIDGKRFDTPSSAAMSITKTSINGWKFWECRLPGKTAWQLIAAMRK